jgi:hypothetical protein
VLHEAVLNLLAPSPDHCTFDDAFDKAGNAFVANADSKDVHSSVYELQCVDGETRCLAERKSLPNEALRATQATENGDVLVGAVLTKQILRFTNDLQEKQNRRAEVHRFQHLGRFTTLDRVTNGQLFAQWHVTDRAGRT